MNNNEKTPSRGLLGLYESLTDEQYDTLNCISYSKIKEVHNDPEVLIRERTASTLEWLIFGTLVDIILTQSKESFDKQVFINDSVPSEQYAQICNYILENELPTELDKLTDSQIEEVYTKSGSSVNWKTDTKRAKLIENCGNYLDILTTHKDKIIISKDQFEEAKKVADVLKYHRWTSDLFCDDLQQEIDQTELYYQFKIKYVYNGVLCKSKIDLIKIDHEAKLITLYDIKTGTDAVRNFAKRSYYKYGYCYQACLYREGFEIFLEKIPLFKDYEVDDFKFVYINRLKPTYPIIVSVDDACHLETKVHGIESPLYDMPSMNELFEEVDYHISKLEDGASIKEPYDLIQSWGEVSVIPVSDKIPF